MNRLVKIIAQPTEIELSRVHMRRKYNLTFTIVTQKFIKYVP